MRLFLVKHTNGSVVTNEHGKVYFDNKLSAKALRDKLNDPEKDNVYRVAPGPDHHKGKSNG